jgi:hypothetical protein
LEENPRPGRSGKYYFALKASSGAAAPAMGDPGGGVNPPVSRKNAARRHATHPGGVFDQKTGVFLEIF